MHSPKTTASTETAISSTTTTGTFRCVDVESVKGDTLPWKKLDNNTYSVEFKQHTWPVENVRGREDQFSLDKCGFAYHRSPTEFPDFDSDASIRNKYYRDVEAQMLKLIPGATRTIVFGHALRHRTEEEHKGPRAWNQARQPASELHVDYDGPTVQKLVRAMLSHEEAEQALKGRYALVNMWRPLNVASDHPLAAVDFRSIGTDDFLTSRLLLPWAQSKTLNQEVFDMSHLEEKEPLPEGYDAVGLGLIVKPNPQFKFYYLKDMTPEEVFLIKCYDSFGEGQPMSRKGISVMTPHAAFDDPLTPPGAPMRRSIEARCLILW